MTKYKYGWLLVATTIFIAPMTMFASGAESNKIELTNKMLLAAPNPPSSVTAVLPVADTGGLPIPGDTFPVNCLSELPAWTNGLNASIDSDCNLTIDGIVFRKDENSFHGTIEGRQNPNYGDYPDVYQNCGLESVINYQVVRQNAPAGDDLLNPGGFGFLKHFVMKNIVLQNTTHLPGGHEDLFQPYRSINGGGWIVFQDSLARNADTNGFVSVGSADDGYGNGPGTEWACPDSIGTGGVLFQGLQIGPNEEGYNGSLQVFIGDPAFLPLPEVWFVDLNYSGLGINLDDTVGKLVIIGGSGGTRGWPGGFKPLRTSHGDIMTEQNCPAGGWNSEKSWCCPNGQINVNGEVASWRATTVQSGDNPANGPIPVYCYEDIETALAHKINGNAVHQEPVFLDWTNTGWSSKGWDK